MTLFSLRNVDGLWCLLARVELTSQELAELQALVCDPDVAATVATRARIVLWQAEGRKKKDVAALAGVSRPTVDLWLDRYVTEGVAGLLDRPRDTGREQVPTRVRALVLALSQTSPPIATGLSYWTSREMAAFVTRVEGVSVSHNYVAKLWRANGIKPRR